MSNGPVSEYGPSWRDVTDTINGLQKEWGHPVEVGTRLWVDKKINRIGLNWFVAVPQARQDGRKLYHFCADGDWPTNQHKTVPGLLMRLLHELEEKILTEPTKLQAKLALSE